MATANKKAEHVAALNATEQSLVEHIASARTALHARFVDAFEKANGAFSPKNMRAQITEMLARERKEIIYKLLGLRNDWNRVEFDNNNRNGILPNLVDETVRAEVERWVETEIRPALLNRAEELSSDLNFKSAIMKEFADRLRWRMRDAIANETDKLAEKYALKLCEEFKGELSMVEKS